MTPPAIKEKFKRTEEKIPHLRFGMLHSFMGLSDGVSIIMQQVENVIVHRLGASKEHIFYLVGKAGKKAENIEEYADFDADTPINILAKERYQTGFSDEERGKIEAAISLAQERIKSFVLTNHIDVIIAHNTSFPANFILALGLSRYYRDEILAGHKTPKYLLWWHDSHLERAAFAFPAKEIERYIYEGIPGPYVEHIIFINSLQYNIAEPYFLKLDQKKPGFYEKMLRSTDVIYNTTDVFIEHYEDLKQEKFQKKVDLFFKDFLLNELFAKTGTSYEETLFVLQHTRMVDRKRIDFALRFCFELLQRNNSIGETGKKKRIYFLVSGNNTGNEKKKLKQLFAELCNEYSQEQITLVFAEDVQTTLVFEDYPLIFARLKGIATYFSEVEGFGNNLLELMASGLIPIIYEYPVYLSDIEKFGFQLLSVDTFEITTDLLDQTLALINDKEKQKIWINKNIKILKHHLSHRTIARKLKRAILLKRSHWRKQKKKANNHG